MSSRRPFKIEVFVAEGLPDGLRLVTKSGWIGQVIVCPQGRYTDVKKDRDEFSRSGVYFLVGDGGKLPTLYIGEGEQVSTRLDRHHSERDWQEAIVVTTTGTQLHKAQIRYLEARLVELARKHRRADLQNKTDPQRPRLSEADKAEMEGYLEELLSLLPVLGIAYFEDVETLDPGRTIYHLTLKGRSARGFETNTGFTVLKGSLARARTLDSMEQHVPSYYRQRQDLIDDGVLEQETDGYRFTQDWPFRSPSAAAAVCLGRNAKGLDDWKDESGNTLRDNREKATE